jgi:predicted RND superfamily exporter protein
VEYKFRTSFIKDHLLYFIDIPDLKDIKTRIQKKIDYERRKKVLSSYLLEDEPVKLDFTDIEEKYEKSTKVLKVTKKTDFFERSESEYEYYINKNEDRLLLLIKPSRESTDLGFAQNLVDRARAVSKRILEQNPNEKISIGYTGRYVKKLEDKEIIERDLKIITPVAFLMILISILIYFRRIRAVLVIGLPLASGLVWATGLVRLTIGHFNVITGFLLAILSGLGVDFGVHLYSRYIEERNRGKDIFESLEIVFRTTFLSNLTSTTTTAAAFFVLIISEFKGFSQFGYTAGMGMLLLLLGMLFAFPSIIVISDKIYPVRGGRQFRKVEHLRGKRVRFFRVIAWAGIIFTIFSMYGLFKANFNADFYSLGAPNTRVKKLEKKAEELIKMSLWPVIIYAQDWDTMKEVTKRINDLKDKGQLPTLDKLDSLYNYVPEKQEEKKKVMLEMKTLLRDSILSKLKGDEKKKVERLREIVDAGYIGLEDVPFELKRQFLGNKEGYFLFYYPNAGLAMSRVSTVKKMVDDLDKVSGQFKKSEIVLGSDAKIFYDIIQLIQREGPMIVALVLFAIFLLLWLDFKSFRSVLITLFPLTVGIIWIFGGMYLFGWKLNYFNIVMFPVIMGLGIDYGVHFFHRYKEEGRDHILFVMRTTGIAILIGGLTDIFGFGTLLFARYEGLATMGELAILGIATCIFAGILFMASLLEARKDAQHHGWLKTLIYRNPGSKK